MPFKSKAQVKFLYSNHPKIAKEFAEHTPSIKALPEKKSRRKTKEAKYSKSTGISIRG